MSILDNFTALWRQNSKQVYNASGKQIGYYDTVENLCAGHWHIFQGETQPAALYVQGAFGALMPVSEFCGANNFKSPGAVPAAQAYDALGPVVSPGDVLVSPAYIPPDVLNLDLPGLSLPSFGTPSGTSVGTVAIWAGVGLLVAVLIAKRA